MIAKAQLTSVPSGRGVAFDTTMLIRPMQRRLMTLWTELSGQRTALLPQVRAELMAVPEFEVPKTLPTARTQRDAWRRSFKPQTPPSRRSLWTRTPATALARSSASSRCRAHPAADQTLPSISVRMPLATRAAVAVVLA